MTSSLRPTGFQLVGLSLVDIGPLRDLTEMRLTNEEGRPTNIYLVMGPNGAGKTTALEAVYTALRLLDARDHAAFRVEALDRGMGGVQLDARVVLDDGVRSRVYLLSIVLGAPGLLKTWKPADLDIVGADRQIVLTYARRGPESRVERTAGSDPEATAFADAVLERVGDPPQALFETANAYPTVLYFPSDRGIRRPPDRDRAITRPAGLGYRPAQRFGTDGASWAESLDNLFVWFAWLDDGREESCRDLVNSLIFRQAKRLGRVDRQSLSVPVEVESLVHRIDQLSSGERQLVQLVVRIASHMTGSTIVLIDETEQHLHLMMRRRLINIIKDWARDHDGMSFMLTSHQADSMRLLAPKRDEPGLVKGGCLVKPRFRPQP
jgi:ABC-type lipoprotein export system ATPase subunit